MRWLCAGCVGCAKFVDFVGFVGYTKKVRIAVDFDETIVKLKTPYDRIDGQFEFVPGAREALHALKNAGHRLLLWSARASAHQRKDWRLNPLQTSSPERDEVALQRRYALNEARFLEMVNFVRAELPGVFEAIDEGNGGKPTVDLFIDDRAQRLGGLGLSWTEIITMYGDSPA